MTQEIFVNLPKLGESIQSATIVQWFKKVGDTVALDEPLLEVSTDKVNSEIPAPSAGIVSKILAQVDEELDVGSLLCVLSPIGASSLKFEAEPALMKEDAVVTTSSNSDFFSPAILRLARENGIALEALGQIQGTGEGNRITKKDIEQYIEKKTQKPSCVNKPSSNCERHERVPMTSMRKAIAENMKKSFYEAPHATLITEVDFTAILKKIQDEKESFVKEYGAKLTVTSFIAKSICEALSKFPLLNASLEGDTILVKKYINLGMAVSVEGGLMVPVIRECQNLCLVGIAKAVSDISAKTRDNRLEPQDVKEGTITLTNFGMSGVAIGVPIIRYPEVAIIGVGAVQKKVVVLENDTFAVRSMVHVSLTFDHRIIDGMYGCAFMNALKTALEGAV